MPGATDLMIVVVAEHVLVNMDIVQVRIAALNADKSVADLAKTGSDGFNLRALQRDSSIEFVTDLIVTANPAVTDFQLARRVLGLRTHRCSRRGRGI